MAKWVSRLEKRSCEKSLRWSVGDALNSDPRSPARLRRDVMRVKKWSGMTGGLGCSNVAK